MLFNSFQFIFVFLPVMLGGFFFIGRFHHKAALAWLALSSFAFYAWWNPANLPILLLSIAWNYGFGSAIHKTKAKRTRSLLLFVGIAGNLAALGFYKYAGLFVTSLNDAFALGLPVPAIALPLGISFFTFTQIAFLADAYANQVKRLRPVPYALFVSYFPHLIAGPIIHHKEVMPQFERVNVARFSPEHFSVGFTIFTMGLLKKVLLADPIAGNASMAFELGKTTVLTFSEAWLAALAYTMQLYFDFSGYSDMAVGLSLMIGVWLPFNFNSPYKATNIVDFWRRWHMTLSRFLRDYLYIPLGGNRRGKYRRYVNIFITMALGGLWHGANWTFLLWGSLHGIYLMVNHAFRHIVKQHNIKLRHPLWRVAAWGLTFTCVVFAWVLFRAETAGQAFSMWHSMLQVQQFFRAGQLQHFAAGWSMRSYLLLAALTALALFAPNTQTIMRRFKESMHASEEEISGARYPEWRPSRAWALAIGLGFVGCLLSLYNVTEFLYFNF